VATVNQSATKTPGEHRAATRARIKRILLSSAEACDVTWRGVLALTLGVTRQRVDQWIALDDEAQLSVADACALPEAMRLALASELAGPAHFVAALPTCDATVSADDWALAAKSQKDTAWSVATHLDVIADGNVTPGEGTALVRACNAAIGTLLTVRELGLRAQRERVVSIRKVAK
jgi:hypothetical protein